MPIPRLTVFFSDKRFNKILYLHRIEAAKQHRFSNSAL